MASTLLPVAAPGHFHRKVPLDATSIAATEVQKETFTVTGLKNGRAVLVNMPTDVTGVVLLNARVTAADTLELTFWNYTGDAVNPSSQSYFIYQP